MADEDMPDLDLLAGVLPAEAAPSAAAAAGPAASDEALDEEDELELALEAELEAEGDGQHGAVQQAAQPPPPVQQQQAALAAPAPALGTLQDAARAGAAAAAVLQQEEEEALPLTADGFIDLDRLTSKQHQRYNTWVGGGCPAACRHVMLHRVSSLAFLIGIFLSPPLTGGLPTLEKEFSMHLRCGCLPPVCSAPACRSSNPPCRLVNDILSEQQLDRYSAFRRSNLRKPMQVRIQGAGVRENWCRGCVLHKHPRTGSSRASRHTASSVPEPSRCPGCPTPLRRPRLVSACTARPSSMPFRPPPQLLMSKTLGGAPNNKALIALSSVTKSFVDDLVATGARGWAWGGARAKLGRGCYAQWSVVQPGAWVASWWRRPGIGRRPARGTAVLGTACPVWCRRVARQGFGWRRGWRGRKG